MNLKELVKLTENKKGSFHRVYMRYKLCKSCWMCWTDLEYTHKRAIFVWVSFKMFNSDWVLGVYKCLRNISCLQGRIKMWHLTQCKYASVKCQFKINRYDKLLPSAHQRRANTRLDSRFVLSTKTRKSITICDTSVWRLVWRRCGDAGGARLVLFWWPSLTNSRYNLGLWNFTNF